MTEIHRKKPNLADDLLDSLGSGVTPIKRPRQSINNSLQSSASKTPNHNRHSNQNSSSKLATSSPQIPSSSSPPHSSSSTTPAISRSNSSQAAPVIPFLLRPSPLALLESLNVHLPLPPSSSTTGTTPRVKLSSTIAPKDYDYRYMFEKMSERADVLDRQIDDAAVVLKEYYGIDEFGDPSVQSQEDIIAIGRLCSETDLAPKLTETSTWLEPSRFLGGGARVLLQFESGMAVRGAPVGSAGCGMFNGCIVGVRGRNGGGKLFSVNEVLMLPPLDATYSRPSDLLSQQYGTSTRQLSGAPMQLVVACGPFTVDSNLSYEPLTALLNLASKEKPDLLLLIGPFVDADHPLIKSGDVTQTPAQIFKENFTKGLNKLVGESPRTNVMMIPHGRELVSHHVAYPQGPLSRDDELGFLPKAIKFLPNPATFSVNEVGISLTSLDVLFHIRNQEFFRKAIEVGVPEGEEADPNAKDVMSRTCRHLLRQRSFYPIFPAPLASSKGIDNVNLDVTHNDLVKMKPNGADIVILPSLLKHFTKIVDSTIMINPSFLTKGNSPGTFARLTIHPMEKDELERRVTDEEEPDEVIEHRVWDRCRVDIVKI
ncbi:DNA polymerase alpha, subunit B [Meredithblackwellia eburnea MCA 4105]